MKSTISILVAIALSVLALHAETVTLNFASLPSAQGWTYLAGYGAGTPFETNVFSVDGMKLFQNTIGAGANYANYGITNLIDPLLPFTIRVRARVLRGERVQQGGPATAFVVVAATGTELFGFSLTTNSINAPSGSTTYHEIDATQFHDYRVEAVPGVSVSIYVDDVLLITRPPPLNSSPNILQLGNASSFENGEAEVTRFVFTQGPPTAPLAWWRAEGDALDSAGTNHGTLVGGTTFGQGWLGQAFQFDGVDDWVQTPATLIDSESLTYAAWVNTTATEGMIISAGDADDRLGWATDLAVVKASEGFQRELDGCLSFYVTDFSTRSAPRVFTRIPYNDGQWHHVVAVFKNTGRRVEDDLIVYVDGLRQAVIAITDERYFRTTRVSFRSVRIGRSDRLEASAADFFNGKVDDVRIYQRALNSSEVFELYANSVRPNVSVSQVRICWNSQARRMYQVQYRTDLVAGEWIDLGSPVQGTGGTLCITDEVTNPNRFHRVIVLP